MNQITKDNFRKLDHVSDDEVKADIEDIERENKNYSDERDVLMRNPQQNKVRIYMLEGKKLANIGQLEQLQTLMRLREESAIKT
jgi:hypothetical protein